MRRLLPFFITGFILVAFLLAVTPEVQAQCPMCKGVAQTSQQEGAADSNGLNAGILYLFLMPYAIAGFIGYQWYRNRKKRT